ncbi:MAG: DUF692 family protein [Immundisolibacteraceae bacterium]|nr:DUF692 family protein [Immundisolibacteraceae bacterium]
MNNAINELPTLGVGASLSLSESPNPVELAATPCGPDFIEYAGQVDVNSAAKEISQIIATGTPVLFHPAYINFCGSFANSPEWLKQTARHINKVSSPWFAQDLAYCFWQQGPGYSTQLGNFLPPILNEASVELAATRIREVQAAVSTLVAIEPPPMTFVVGTMSLLSFIGELATKTDCAILLDMGHLVSYEMASSNRVTDELAALPCERVIEVHIAGGRLVSDDTAPVYVDAHESAILDQSWQMLTTLLPLLPNLKAVCYECEGMDEQTVIKTLRTIRQLVRQHSSAAPLVARLDAGNKP